MRSLLTAGLLAATVLVLAFTTSGSRHEALQAAAAGVSPAPNIAELSARVDQLETTVKNKTALLDETIKHVKALEDRAGVIERTAQRTIDCFLVHRHATVNQNIGGGQIAVIADGMLFPAERQRCKVPAGYQ
jgi:hypothetical protein